MKKFVNNQVMTIACINFLYCFAIYTTLPVLALYFNLNLHLSLAQVGILLGIPPIVSSVFSYLSAPISKKIGVMNSLIAGIILLILPYISYIFIKSFPILILISLVQGFSRVLWEPVVKYLFSYHAKKIENQELVFRIKYITICLGAILGPLLGIYLSNFGKQFNISFSIIIFVLLIGFLIITKRYLDTEANMEEKKTKISFSQLKLVNPVLIFYIIANMLVYFVFSQFETVFSLSLKEFSKSPEKLFSTLLVLNSISGIVLQSLIIFISKKMNTIMTILVGNIAFAFAFCLFGFSKGELLLLVLATIIFSIGEVLAIPGTDIVINEIAPEDKKTLYFGFAEFKIIGFSLGPAFASLILQRYGYTAMFMSSVFIIIAASVIYSVPRFFKFKSAHETLIPASEES